MKRNKFLEKIRKNIPAETRKRVRSHADKLIKKHEAMEGSIFSEIRSDYADDKGVIHLDGYKTADDNEEGTGIGYFINGEIYWRDPEFQFDPYVKEVLAELKNNYEEEKKAKEKKIRNAVRNVVYTPDAKPRLVYTDGSPLEKKLAYINEAVEKIKEICNF